MLMMVALLAVPTAIHFIIHDHPAMIVYLHLITIIYNTLDRELYLQYRCEHTNCNSYLQYLIFEHVSMTLRH